MINTIIIELYLLVCTLFLAGKDASSLRMKDKSDKYAELMKKRISRWHRDGVVLHILFVVPVVYYTQNYWLILYAVLIRLSVFDIAFNFWAGIGTKYLGTTAITDRIFSRLFGADGAYKKSISFFLILIALNISHHFFS